MSTAPAIRNPNNRLSDWPVGRIGNRLGAFCLDFDAAALTFLRVDFVAISAL